MRITRAAPLAILAALLIGLAPVFADGPSGTQTTPSDAAAATGMSITAPLTYGFGATDCPANIGPDSVTITLTPTALSNTVLSANEYVVLTDSSGNQTRQDIPQSITYNGTTYNSPATFTVPLGQTSTITFNYPATSQWPLSSADGTHEIHAQVDMGAYGPPGYSFPTTYNIAEGWDVFCLGTPTPPPPPPPPPSNACAGIFTPGYWKNYQNHYSKDQFYALLKGTQDFGPTFASLSEDQAIVLAEQILRLQGYYNVRSLLTAELNVEALAGFGNEVYTPYSSTQTISSWLHQIYVDNGTGNVSPFRNGTLTTQEQQVLSYLSGGGENVSASSCLVQPAP